MARAPDILDIQTYLASCLVNHRKHDEVAAGRAVSSLYKVLRLDSRSFLSPLNTYEHYQPQVNPDGNIIGAEALLRWQHPERGLLPPSQFIPLAEETGLILSIGQWVLDEACKVLAAWANHPHTKDLQLAINVSARQFRQPNFVASVRQALTSSQAQPQRLKLELTESLVLDNVEDSIGKMVALRQIGVGFSMDDFGTGYSSLSYLTRLPLDQLKIDQSFVRKLPDNASDAVVAQSIIMLASSLSLAVIAEGVETEAQRAFLEQHGCPIYQGYLFSKPVELPKFEALLTGRKLNLDVAEHVIDNVSVVI